MFVVEVVNLGKGVVFLIDMFGGMLFNFVIFVMESKFVEVVVGVNLLMLIKFVSVCVDWELE